MTIDKLVRKAEFSETLNVFVKGADGMYLRSASVTGKILTDQPISEVA
jgi:hypothetical protein